MELPSPDELAAASTPEIQMPNKASEVVTLQLMIGSKKLFHLPSQLQIMKQRLFKLVAVRMTVRMMQTYQLLTL